jgi:hypothetical protein
MVTLSTRIGVAAVLLGLAGCAKPNVPHPPPVPPTLQAAPMTVTLHHCGLNPISYRGQTWEAGPATLFDATNKPDEWQGYGTVTELSSTRLLYRDESDIEATFLPDAEVPPQGTCA